MKLELDRIAVKLMWASGVALIVMSASAALAQNAASADRDNKVLVDVLSPTHRMTAQAPAPSRTNSRATSAAPSVMLPKLGNHRTQASAHPLV